MSASKLRVGIRIKIEYEGKWYFADIIEMTNNNIVIRLWKTVYKNKLFDIPRKPNWINLVIQKKIYDMTNYQNEIFPEWVKFGQTVCMSNKYKSTYHKISNYIDGKYIELTGIDGDSPNLQIKTNKYCLEEMHHNKSHSYLEITIIKDQECHDTLFIFTVQPEHHNINNRNLMKKIASIQRNEYKHTTKTTSKPITKLTDDDIRHFEFGQFVEDSSKKYKKLLMNDGNGIFPNEVNEIILSFVSEKLIFICPPSRCIKKDIEYFGSLTKIKFIACEFKMDINVKVCGFRLYDDNLISKAYYMHFTTLDTKISKYGIGYVVTGQDNDFSTDFLFDEAMIFSRGNDKKYRLLLPLVMKQNKTRYSWHDRRRKVLKWKIFKQMKWMEYKFDGSASADENKYNLKHGIRTSLFEIGNKWSTPIFPHIAMILE